MLEASFSSVFCFLIRSDLFVVMLFCRAGMVVEDVGLQLFGIASHPAVCRYAGAHGREGFQPFPPYIFFSVFFAYSIFIYVH